MKNLITFVLLAFVSVAAFADGGRSGYVDLSDTRLQLIQDGNSRLYVYDVTMNDSTCDIKTTPVVLFNEGAINKEFYSMILSAKVAGDQIELISVSCVAIGATTYPLVHAIYMK